MKKRNHFRIALAVSSSAVLLATATNVNTVTASSAQTDQESSRDSIKTTSDHKPVTIQTPYRNMTNFITLLQETYPEINIEVIPYSGANMTTYLTDELKAGEIPDVYFTTVYSPTQQHLGDRLIDLSSYSFTNNYSEVRLREVADEGAIYLLPTYFTCFGITYNKTLLEENGWELPKTFEELRELKPKVEEAGYNFALAQIALPGYGFQYLCNILDTCFLNTIDGRKWQKDFLNGETTIADSPEMKQALQRIEEWKELGLLNANGDPTSDGNTKKMMAEGNTLFMLGSNNTFAEDESDCEFGLMPYLSEDGTQNALIMNVSRYVGLSKRLEEPGNEQKLEDALHVMEVLSTVEGMRSLSDNFGDTSLLPLQDYQIPESSYYKQVEDELNAGATAPFIYSGWENLIVPIGNIMIQYIKGEVTIDEVAQSIDDNQHLLQDASPSTYTTVTEELSTDDCARLVGICFAQATDSDLALVSKNKWYPHEDDSDLNLNGVSGQLFALPVTDQEITSILPTGWRGNIETVTLTGKRIKELYEFGYDRNGDGNTFPYELVMPEKMELDDETTYKVAICGVTDEVAEEGNLTDSGILGLKAAEDYFGQYHTFSKKDIVWE